MVSIVDAKSSIEADLSGMRLKLKYQDVQSFCCRVGHIVNYVTKVAARSTHKNAGEAGI